MSHPLDSCKHLAHFQVQSVWLTKPCCWARNQHSAFPKATLPVACPTPDPASMEPEAGPLLQDKVSTDGCFQLERSQVDMLNSPQSTQQAGNHPPSSPCSLLHLRPDSARPFPLIGTSSNKGVKPAGCLLFTITPCIFTLASEQSPGSLQAISRKNWVVVDLTILYVSFYTFSFFLVNIQKNLVSKLENKYNVEEKSEK